MANRNNRNSLWDCLMDRNVAVSVLVAVFVLVGLASPAIAQASSDAALVMHFDEGSGTIAKDESGHGNDGTIYGATWMTGVSGKALEFDGSNDYVDCGYDSSLDITDAITVEAWVNAKLSTANQVIVDKYKPGVGGYMLDVRSTGNFGFLVIFSDGGDGIARSSMTTNEWIHLVGVYNGIGNTYLYINGNLTDSDYDAGKTTLITNDKSATIGYPYTRFNYFNGIIDEVAIYNRALSPEEIKAHYLAKRAGGSSEESASELISSVPTRIDVLKRSNVDTSLIEQALKNARNTYDFGKYDEAYELAQSALKMADDAYEAQQRIESAQSEIDDAKSIGAEVKEAGAKLKEAKEALDKGNYEYACNWAADASELAKHASIGSVQIKDLKALATKYDERTVVVSGTIRDIETVYGEGYTFALDDGSGMISVVYQGSLGDIRDGDKVTVSGIFQASTGTLVADTVQKSGVGGGGVPGFEVIFAIAGLLVAVYLLKRK